MTCRNESSSRPRPARSRLALVTRYCSLQLRTVDPRRAHRPGCPFSIRLLAWSPDGPARLAGSFSSFRAPTGRVSRRSRTPDCGLPGRPAELCKSSPIGGNSRFFWRPQATRLVHRHHFGSNEERCCEKPDFELIHDFGPPGRNPTVASSAMRVPKVTPFGHDFRHMLYEPRDLKVGKMSAEARGVLRFYRLAHLVSGSPAVLRRASPGTRVAAARATRRG